MTSTQTAHNATDCRLCRRLAEGKPDTSPFCARCGSHHWPNLAHSTEGLPKSTCPRCRERKREVEHIIQAFRADRKRYATYCEPCLIEEGYVQRYVETSAEGRLTWWVQPVEGPVDTAEDPFAGL